jgi:MFS transporter, FHS family, Na+ dependent glucose transporter 1
MEASKFKSTFRSITPVTLAYFSSFITLGLFTSILGPTLPGLAENTNTRISEIGILFTARSLGYMFGALRGGKAFDRLPGHYLLSAVLLLLGCVVLMVPFIRHLWLLTFLLFLLGIGESGLDIGVNLMMVWAHRGRTGPFLNALHFFFGIGAFLSPIIVAQILIMSGSITGAFWSLTFFAFPIALWLLRIKSPDLHRNNFVNSDDQQNHFFILLISLLFILYVGAEVSFGGWIFTYTVSLDLGDSTTAAYLTSAFWGALTVGRLLGIPLSGRVSPRKILLFDLVGCLFCLSIVILFPNSYLAIWVGTIGLGFFMASFYPTVLAFAERRIVLNGQITRWFFFASGIGGMILPWLFGILFEATSPQWAMKAIMVDLLLALVLFVVGIFRLKSVQIEYS